MYLGTKKTALSLAIGFWLVSSAVVAEKMKFVARHIESNEITETDAKGAVKLIKTTAENCQKMLSGLVADIKKLSQFISKIDLQKSEAKQIKVLEFNESDCANRERRQEMFQFASQMIREHSKTIAVLLPLSTLTAAHAQSVKIGIQKGLGLSDAEFSKRIVFLDTHGNILGTEQAIAQAYFIHNATMLVGGMSLIEAEKISYWSRKILMPALITNYSKALIEKNGRAFLVFPNLENLYKGIMETLNTQGLKKLAILYPNSPGNLEMIQQFAVVMENGGIKITHKASYNPDDYQSMEAAAQKIFEIDRGLRRDEYNRIYRNLRRRAIRAKTQFNPRLVSLPPIVNMDAVYIADNFRSVRYMAKIFDYLGVEKIRLFGNQQWRAKSLVDPWDPFLDGAYFVDYVGNYASLPAGLAIQNMNVFASPSQAQHIDFKLIGYLSGYVSKQVLFAREPSRSQLHRYIKDLNINEDRFFGQRKVFLDDRSANWPYFKFMVGARTIQLSH